MHLVVFIENDHFAVPLIIRSFLNFYIDHTRAWTLFSLTTTQPLTHRIRTRKHWKAFKISGPAYRSNQQQPKSHHINIYIPNTYCLRTYFLIFVIYMSTQRGKTTWAKELDGTTTTSRHNGWLSACSQRLLQRPTETHATSHRSTDLGALWSDWPFTTTRCIPAKNENKMRRRQHSAYKFALTALCGSPHRSPGDSYGISFRTIHTNVRRLDGCSQSIRIVTYRQACVGARRAFTQWKLW